MSRTTDGGWNLPPLLLEHFLACIRKWHCLPVSSSKQYLLLPVDITFAGANSTPTNGRGRTLQEEKSIQSDNLPFFLQKELGGEGK